MVISCNFPGGNIVLKSIDNSHGETEVHLEQDLKGTARNWFWWYFKVEKTHAETVRFCFENGSVVGHYGPAMSCDGVNWTWLYQYRDENTPQLHTEFSYTFSENETVYFAFSIPYLQAEFEKFVEVFRADAQFRLSTLTKSEQGRELPLVIAGQGNKNIVLTARHHCCESTGSYALEGFMRALLTKHRDMLETYTFYVIPFVDLDGVQNGDQGKDRDPHDHNRDYIEVPIYRSTRAICALFANKEIEACLDFHSPWKWGEYDSVPHIHRGSKQNGANAFDDAFFDQLEQITKECRIRFAWDRSGRTRMGVVANAEGTPCCKNYFALTKRPKISVTIETPYAGNNRDGYTRGELLDWGADILLALKKTI